MRKFTLLIASLFITIGAMAQSNSYTRIAEFEAARTNSKVYALKTTRSPLYFNTQYNELAGYWTTQAQALQGEQANAAATAQQFAFLRTDKTAAGQYYMYSVEGQCFITTAGAKSDEPEILVSFADVTDKDDANHQGLKLYLGTTGNNVVNVTYWNSNTAGGVRYNTNSEADAGNVYELIAYDQDVDLSEAIAKIEAFEADNTEAVAELDEAIDKAIAMSAFIGEGVGKYSYTGDGDYQDKFAEIVAFREGITATNTPTPEEVAAKTAELNALLSSFVLNMPKNGEYFRVAYDYGGTIGKLYLQGIDSEQIKNNQVSPPAKFSSETGAESIWYYYDGVLYSYTAGKCLREDGNNRGLQSIGTKTTATFSASTRVEGKYNIACSSYIHANSTGENYYTDHCTANNCAAHDLILEAVTELPVTVTAAGYATLYAPVALTVPSEVKAYTVTINGEWATLNEIEGGVIPANTGVIIAGANGEAATAGTYNFAITTSEETLESDLRGSAPATYYTEAGTYYALAQLNGEVGFYKDEFNNSRFQNNSHKAYLYIAAEAAASAASYSFRFGDGTTGIDQITDNREQSTVIYDLTGRRIDAITAPGIYIVNGVKKLVR